jgi:hypothetical protein
VLSAGGAGGVAGHAGGGVETGDGAGGAVDEALSVVGETAGLAEGADVGLGAGSAAVGAPEAGEAGLVESRSASADAAVVLEEERDVADLAAGGGGAGLAASHTRHTLTLGVDEAALGADGKTGNKDEVSFNSGASSG